MATTPSTAAALQAYLDRRFTAFEDRSVTLLCDISTGLQNRITKEMDIVTKYIWEIMTRVSALEARRDQNQNVHDFTPRSSGLGDLAPSGVDERHRPQARRSA